MAILGVDLSRFQGNPNFAAIKASGHDFVVLKASEGVGYKDPVFDANRTAAHAQGLLVGIYHFARGGANTPGAESSWFLQCVGALQVGEFVVIDDEVSGITPPWVQTWCRAVTGRTTVHPLVYINQNLRDTQDWSGVVADDDGLWLAKYDGTLTQPSSGAWPGTAMKQYSDAGTVAGIAGQVDLDVFYGTVDQLAKYGLQPQEVDMNVDSIDLAVVKEIKDFVWRDPQLDGKGPAIVRLDGIAQEVGTVSAAVAALAAQVAELKTAGTPVIDEAKLAAALLSDPKNVDALGAAIAAHLQLTPRN